MQNVEYGVRYEGGLVDPGFSEEQARVWVETHPTDALVRRTVSAWEDATQANPAECDHESYDHCGLCGSYWTRCTPAFISGGGVCATEPRRALREHEKKGRDDAGHMHWIDRASMQGQR